MRQYIDSEELSSKWVTSSGLVSKMACEICIMVLTCDSANGNATIYDGEDDTGKVIMVIKGLQNRSVDIHIDHHIYCRRGIYVVLSSPVFGLFIQWRMRPSKEG